MIVGALIGLAVFAAINVAIDVDNRRKGRGYQLPNPMGLLLLTVVGALIGALV